MAAYAQQQGSARMRELLDQERVAVSRLAEVETVSALARLAREDAITESSRDAAVTAFLDDLAGWEIVELSPMVTARARDALLVHALRAADAVQLASALVLQSRLDEPLAAFVSFDRRLLEAASGEDLAVLTAS